ncbi:hypothetical protein ACOMHN_058493 [Nucella lapillus]
MLDFARPYFRTVIVNKDKVCPPDQWNHPKERCQKLLCSAGKLADPYNALFCTTPVHRLRGLGYHLKLLFTPVLLTLKTLNEKEKERLKKTQRYCDYFDLIQSSLYDFDGVFAKAGTITLARVPDEACFHQAFQSSLDELKNDSFASHRFVQNVKGQWELDIGKDLQTDASFLVAVAEMDIIAGDHLSRDSFEYKLLDAITEGLVIPFGEWTVKLEALDLTSGLYGDGYSAYVGTDGQSRFFDYWKRHPALHGLEHLFLPVSNRLFCQHVRFHKDEFQMDISDGQMQISFPFYVDSDLMPVSFDPRAYPGDVWVNDDHLVMCFKTFDSVFPENVSYTPPPDLAVISHRSSGAGEILSTMCSSLSVACLTVTFITYVLFSELRTLPGLNNMGLCLTLAAANLSLLMDWIRVSSIKQVCSAVGAVTHWLWLMALLWMGVCCAHMMRVFLSKTRVVLHQREVKKVFVLNVVLTVAVSAAVVVLTMVISAAVSGGSTIGYGGSLCLFDKSQLPLLPLAFMLPLGLVVVTNLVCLGVTLSAIRRVRRLQAQRVKGYWEVLVYAKLTTVTGGAWLLAIVGELADVHWLLVLADVCTASQGMLVFLSFTCNRRICLLYRARFGCSVPAASPSTTGTPVAVSSKKQTPPAAV